MVIRMEGIGLMTQAEPDPTHFVNSLMVPRPGSRRTASRLSDFDVPLAATRPVRIVLDAGPWGVF